MSRRALSTSFQTKRFPKISSILAWKRRLIFKGRQAEGGKDGLYFKKLEMDEIVIEARNDIRGHTRDKAYANDVAIEIEILTSLPGVPNSPEELTRDIFNVTFQDSWRWIVYLETALREMTEALRDDYFFHAQEVEEERLHYLQSEVMSKWPEFLGNPCLRLQRLRQNLLLANDEERLAAGSAKMAARMEEAMAKYIERLREKLMERKN
jgi:hypothetical protein